MFVWSYCFIFFLLQDVCKVLANILLDNVFEVTSNSAKRTKKRVLATNRRMIENQQRLQQGDKYSSRRQISSKKSFSQMDMATALHRINDLTAELEKLKAVVERHAGIDSSTIESKTSVTNSGNTRKRSDKSLLSSKSRDAAGASRTRSESQNW